MIEHPNIKELLTELSAIESRLESLSNLPTAQSKVPLTFHKPLPLDVLSELEQAQNSVQRARRLLMGLDIQS